MFYENKTLHVWHGSQCTSGLLKLFWYDSQRDTQVCAKLIIVFTPNLEFSPYLEVIHGSTTFKLTKG